MEYRPASKKALFLDRDGTINEERNYVYKKEDFEFRKGIFDLVKAYYDAGYYIFVVTNQSGIARGYYSEKDFQDLTGWMRARFEENGIRITGVYHCPHHPEITGLCRCRKPDSGMLIAAMEEYGIDPAGSVMIGDKESDVEAGLKAGIGKVIKIDDSGDIDIANGTVYFGGDTPDQRLLR